MKTKNILFSILLYALAWSAGAQVLEQNFLQIDEVSVVNLGDGRLLHRRAEGRAPLQGEHRIVDGDRSEYILAEFTDGLYDGKWEQYKNNVPVETGTYREGRRHGTFTEYYSDGRRIKSETPFAAGRRHGIRRTYYTDGQPELEKGYREGQEHGVERRWDHGAQEPRIDHNYFAGKRDGRQITRFSSNAGDFVEESHFNMGLPAGEFLQRWNSGELRTRGQFDRNGKKNGTWIESRRDGTDDDSWRRYEVIYKHDEVLRERRYRGE